MSDANEERLLTSLLREVAEGDACIKVRADLEERVLSRRLGKQLIPMRMVGRSTSTGRSRGSITSLSEKPAW